MISTPSTAPRSTVSPAVRVTGISGLRACAAAVSRSRSSRNTAVTASTTASMSDSGREAVAPLRWYTRIASTVSTVAGTLPSAMRPTSRQSTVRLAACTPVPTALVPEA